MLPTKKARKAPEKIQVSKENIAELSETAKPDITEEPSTEDVEVDQENVSLDQISESENQNSEDPENSGT